MAGGVIQLIIYGSQDMYLTANPQITYFKVVYRRHTNFSIEPHELQVQTNPNFGQISSVELFRLGDLITKIYLRVVISGVNLNNNEKFAWIRRLGHAIIKNIEINIGGYTVDKQCGTWLDIWYELARQGYHERGYAHMIGDVPIMTEYNSKSKPEYTLLIPLKFWFNQFYGLALPIIGIRYHRIEFKLEYEKIEKLIIKNDKFNNLNQIKILNTSYIIDYIYLDVIERNYFATIPHEYLIEQVQFHGEDVRNDMIEKYYLHYNHPIKELYWIMRNGNYINSKSFLCYTHKDNWNDEIIKCTKQVILDSSILLDLLAQPPNNGGTWETFMANTVDTTMNGKITVNNMSSKNFSLNTSSLIFRGNNIINNISANITINANEKIIINIITPLTETDISIPIEFYDDTRIKSDDVYVNQFSNYGIYITGRGNPIESTKFITDEEDRFRRRNYIFYNYLQPEIHHSNTPKDGINCYSFAVFPEQHQPSGTFNMSRVLNNIIQMWFTNPIIIDENKYCGIDSIINEDRIHIYAKSYNIFRVENGLTAIAYMN